MGDGIKHRLAERERGRRRLKPTVAAAARDVELRVA